MSDLSVRTSNALYFSWAQKLYYPIISVVTEHIRTRRAQKEARAAFNNICHLDDKMLNDIGVSREEVDWALSLPLEVNASKAVFMKARRRREGEK